MGKKYQIIYADPPWDYDDKKNCDPKMGGITYPVLKLPILKTLKVPEICDKNCLLFLWVTGPKLPEAIELMKAWGFKYLTVAFNWIKINRDGSLRTGLGHYSRSCSEFVLLGKKGSIKRVNNKVLQGLMEPIRGHSSKPLEIRERILKLVGPLSMIELFARERDHRIDCIGNDISGKDISVEIEELLNGTWKQS